MVGSKQKAVINDDYRVFFILKIGVEEYHWKYSLEFLFCLVMNSEGKYEII